MPLLLPAIAFGITVVLHLVAMYLFPKWRLLDYPERYQLTRRPLPYPTGILAVLCFVGMFIAVAPWVMQSAGIVAGILMLAGISFLDDRYDIPAPVRLLVHAFVALLIFATGTRIYTLTNPLLADGILSLDTVDIMTSWFGPLPLWSGVFTLFWLMLTINALNWFDGIPGQVSVLSTIGFVVIGLLSFSSRVDQPELGIIALTLAGIALGCTLFNFPPNRVVMGDTGAMFFGLTLGVLTIYSGGKVATAFLVLGVPLIDLALVIMQRLLKGKNPLKGSGSGEHLHHRLLAIGWSERQVIGFTATIGTAFGVTALYVSTIGKMLSALVLALIMIGLWFYTEKKNG